MRSPSSKTSVISCVPWLLLRDADVLWLGEETEGFFTAFAADAALFHAAERGAHSVGYLLRRISALTGPPGFSFELKPKYNRSVLFSLI